MKTKKTAKEKRAEESQKRKEFWNRDREFHSAAPAPQVQAQAERISAKERALRQEAETREFLEYLQRDISVTKEEPENTMNARRKTARKTLLALSAGILLAFLMKATIPDPGGHAVPHGRHRFLYGHHFHDAGADL